MPRLPRIFTLIAPLFLYSPVFSNPSPPTPHYDHHHRGIMTPDGIFIPYDQLQYHHEINGRTVWSPHYVPSFIPYPTPTTNSIDHRYVYPNIHGNGFGLGTEMNGEMNGYGNGYDGRFVRTMAYESQSSGFGSSSFEGTRTMSVNSDTSSITGPVLKTLQKVVSKSGDRHDSARDEVEESKSDVGTGKQVVLDEEPKSVVERNRKYVDAETQTSDHVATSTSDHVEVDRDSIDQDNPQSVETEATTEASQTSFNETFPKYGVDASHQTTMPIETLDNFDFDPVDEDEIFHDSVSIFEEDENDDYFDAEQKFGVDCDLALKEGNSSDINGCDNKSDRVTQSDSQQEFSQTAETISQNSTRKKDKVLDSKKQRKKQKPKSKPKKPTVEIEKPKNLPAPPSHLSTVYQISCQGLSYLMIMTKRAIVCTPSMILRVFKSQWLVKVLITNIILRKQLQQQRFNEAIQKTRRHFLNLESYFPMMVKTGDKFVNLLKKIKRHPSEVLLLSPREFEKIYRRAAKVFKEFKMACYKFHINLLVFEEKLENILGNQKKFGPTDSRLLKKSFRYWGLMQLFQPLFEDGQRKITLSDDDGYFYRFLVNRQTYPTWTKTIKEKREAAHVLHSFGLWDAAVPKEQSWASAFMKLPDKLQY